MVELEIWAPRYSTNDCCVLASKVKKEAETYKIWFSQADHLKGDEYVMTGAEIKQHGVLGEMKHERKVVYAIPMATLEKFKVMEVL